MKKKRPYIKILRSKVMIIARKELALDTDTFYQMLESWGYGTSLRKLSIGELNDIISLMRGELDPADISYGIGALDAQGKYMYSLMKDAGWDMKRLRLWWLKKMSASHWNALTDNEKRATIAMLKNYIDKGE